MKTSPGRRLAGTILAAVWVFGGTAFYLYRFGTAFYNDHGQAIQSALEKLCGAK